MLTRLQLPLLLVVIGWCASAPLNSNQRTLVRSGGQSNASDSSPRISPQDAAQLAPQDASIPIRRYSIKDHPYYAPFISRALANLVRQHGNSKRNHFYVSQIKEYNNGQDGPWIFWKERRILMTWDRNAGTNKQGEQAPEFDLVSWWPRHVYRLERDLVKGRYANGNDRLTGADAAEIIRDCKHGELFLIKVP